MFCGFFQLSAVNFTLAHTSNQAFVPLLPTDLYIGAGVVAVALTVLLLATPWFGHVLSNLPAFAIFKVPTSDFSTPISICFFVFLMFLVHLGFTGSHDPLVNPLPLFFWTVFWVGLITLHAVFGNLWHWLNPWTGPYDLFRRVTGWTSPLQLPSFAHTWPAIVVFLAFTVFMLASISPEDPSQLALYVSGYILVTFVGMLLFGRDEWLENFECFTVLMRNFSKLAIIGVANGQVCLGVPGWQLKNLEFKSIIAGLFVVVVFASSSFDGLNETFWWLEFLGINPLEYPGRSFVFWQTVAGLLAFNVFMIVSFTTCVWIGLRLISSETLLYSAFFRLAMCIIPIAVAYHAAHFLTSFLVNIQYSLAAASDPWTDGSDYLGLGTFYVTTGFFNTLESVRVIFLTQVVLIVTGHLISIVSAHSAALEMTGNHRKAVISQIPLAAFMVAYTFFGLWLLAAPRGA